MLRHQDIWKAIDRLAAKHGLSASGLARRAGLDPTTFNKSKRVGPDGRLRWPSTESVSKILDATIERARRGLARKLPLLGYAQAGAEGYFDDAGYPTGSGWDEIEFPEAVDPDAYALKVTGDSMEPVYRKGDVLIVVPDVEIKRGDRVVVKTAGGEVMAKEVLRSSTRKLELRSLNSRHPDRALTPRDIQWIARILWVSQ